MLVLIWLNPFTYGPFATIAQSLVTFLCATLWYLATINRPPNQHLRSITSAWYFAALVSAVIGLVQYFGATQPLAWVISYVEPGQMYGNLRQRNQFATLLNMGLAAWWLWGREWLAQGRVRNVLGWLGVVLLAGANALSGSRTGLLQLLLLCVLAWVWGKDKKVMVVALLSYVLAAVVVPWLAGWGWLSSGILSRTAEQVDCGSRLTLWSNVWALIRALPWAGWGWGELGYAHFVTLFDGPRFCSLLDNAHNLPLHWAVTLGLPIAGLLCAAALWLVWRGRPWREVQSARQVAWAVLAVIGLHSLLEFPLWYAPFQLAVLLCVYMLWVVRTDRDGALALQTLTPRAQKISTLLASGLIVLCLLVGWDYVRVSQIYMPPERRLAMYREDTLAKIQNTIFFKNHVRFAELTTMEVNPENAPQMYALALAMLHFSAEPLVVERLIVSAQFLGKADEVAFYQARAQAAFGPPASAAKPAP